jgi:hypothetical protein
MFEKQHAGKKTCEKRGRVLEVELIVFPTLYKVVRSSPERKRDNLSSESLPALKS